MRKFKFDIDDWTGGNTIGKSMGDAIGSTVPNVTFTLDLSIVDNEPISFNYNGLVPILIDWGDGTKNKYNKKGTIQHKYQKTEDVLLKVFIESKYLDILNKESVAHTGALSSNPILINYNNDNKVFNEYNIYGIQGIAHNYFLKYQSENSYEIYEFPEITINVKECIHTLKPYTFASTKLYGTINLPNSLTKIEDFVFTNTTFYGDIIIPDSVTYIGTDVFNNSSFYNCDTVSLPFSIDTVPDCMFLLYHGDEFIPLPRISNIGRVSFAYAYVSSNLVIPNYIKNIDSFAFYSALIYTITFDEGIKSIGNFAFATHTMACDVILPESLELLYESAFLKLGDRSVPPKSEALTVYVCEDTSIIPHKATGNYVKPNIVKYKKGNKPKQKSFDL